MRGKPEMLMVKDLRDSFLKFFEERGHRIVQSSSLVPKDDPTLLFTTAGMVQFKPMFAGTVNLEYTRAATVQKCLHSPQEVQVIETFLGRVFSGKAVKKIHRADTGIYPVRSSDRCRNLRCHFHLGWFGISCLRLDDSHN